MNVKKKIRTELDTLVVTVAESYNDLITEDIPDKQFEKAAEAVQGATDTAESNLVDVANEVVKETILMIEEQAEKKADRLTKMLPVDLATKPDITAVVPVERTPMTLEGPVTPLPTEVSEPGEVFTPPNMDQLVEQAEQVALEGGGIGGGAGLVDIDNTVKVDHDLGLTVAEENRMKQGLPPKVHRPTIHVTGKPLQMNPEPAPEAPKAPLVDTRHADALRQIGNMVKGHVNAPNEAVAMLAGNILPVVEAALGENFTEGTADAE
jgi:hypothetical protein